tara:strand:+ start:252 stop:425 length:174 start_codon:yes stop_codon:yes gene_type:complete
MSVLLTLLLGTSLILLMMSQSEINWQIVSLIFALISGFFVGALTGIHVMEDERKKKG